MRITRCTTLHADGGWRNFSFLKVETDEGLVGWSEFNESSWNRGLNEIVQILCGRVVGQDPRQVGRLSAELHAITRMAPGGLNHQAVAAIENACLDLAGKAAGLPVYAMFGGPYRTRLPLYWSHCGSFRVRNAAFFENVIGTPPLRELSDLKDLGEEARNRGYRAVKTNPLFFGPEGPTMFNSGFGPGFDPAQLGEAVTIRAIMEQVTALKAGLGDIGLMLDVNFAYRPEALRRLARALEPFGLIWLEADLHDPEALALLRRSTETEIASLEAIYGKRNYRPYLQHQAVGTAIVDVPWNGFLEAVRICTLADAFEVNVAPHNFYGHLASAMSAHLCSAVPNFQIMEYEGDDVPWKDELVSEPPRIEDGAYVLNDAPGWGMNVNEEAVAMHPPR